MAEWPVEIEDGPISLKVEPVRAGETLGVRRTSKDGKLYGYLVRCPKCGNWGDCPVAIGGTRNWTASEEGGKLTMFPSILCVCGGHYWLHDGVLRDV